ncbi:unnamed protein product [Hyaloperonospora brassicae]|uniref:Uncharacterized protein n=1 Tax=Hyaloperonospora brassicae TaxID=162125 RepID=A0AAV0TK86_HYABA|nr:unnamed protein product [Hyaloperonospora brassicae]
MTDKRQLSARCSKGPYRAKRALAFGSPSSSTAVSFVRPRLSPVHRKKRAPTDADATDAARTALTFLQSARDRNVPVRYGKWGREEDAYLEKLLTLFQDGVLANVTAKTTLRSWLAHMLNCCPMRISKKQMHGRQFEGKAKYKRQSSNVDSMTQTQYDRLCTELWHARAEFLRAWANDEYARRSAKLRRSTDATLTDWYDNVLRLVPTPVIAKRSSVVECTERRTPVEELRQEMQTDAKRQKVETLAETRATTSLEASARPPASPSPASISASQEPLDTLDEPWQVPTLLAEPSTAVVTALPTAYCTDNKFDTMTMGDYWLHDLDERQRAAQWAADIWQSREVVRDAPNDVEMHVSSHVCDQQQNAELLMSRGASRVFIDFGAPSCWYAGEEPKRAQSGDWMGNHDLTADSLAMSLEPNDVFGWGESSPVASMAYSPTLQFL